MFYLQKMFKANHVQQLCGFIWPLTPLHTHFPVPPGHASFRSLLCVGGPWEMHRELNVFRLANRCGRWNLGVTDDAHGTFGYVWHMTPYHELAGTGVEDATSKARHVSLQAGATRHSLLAIFLKLQALLGFVWFCLKSFRQLLEFTTACGLSHRKKVANPRTPLGREDFVLSLDELRRCCQIFEKMRPRASNKLPTQIFTKWSKWGKEEHRIPPAGIWQMSYFADFWTQNPQPTRETMGVLGWLKVVWRGDDGNLWPPGCKVRGWKIAPLFCDVSIVDQHLEDNFSYFFHRNS